jgi:hypothetical protein
MHPAITSRPGYIVTQTLKPMQNLINLQSNVTQSVDYPLDVHRVINSSHIHNSKEINIF